MEDIETKVVDGVTYTKHEGDIQWVAHEENEDE